MMPREETVAGAGTLGQPAQLTAEAAVAETTDREIAALAYEFWMQRGCPIGSPEEDWFRAEQELKKREMKCQAAAA